eukprot:3035356-Pleurochrysis_carterae.AAC.1
MLPESIAGGASSFVCVCEVVSHASVPFGCASRALTRHILRVPQVPDARALRSRALAVSYFIDGAVRVADPADGYGEDRESHH